MGDKKKLYLSQVCTMLMLMILLVFLWLIVIVVPAKAEIWRDDFNDKELKGWKPTGEFFIWEVQDGLLHVSHVKPLPPKQLSQLEALQLTAFPGPHQQLTITATNLKTAVPGGFGFGIALGKRFPEIPGVGPFYYVFFTNSIYDRRFSGKGGSSPFLHWIPTHPGIRWETTELKEMKLVFNSGRFQMFANGELRADFEDFHFDQIELLTLRSKPNRLHLLKCRKSNLKGVYIKFGLQGKVVQFGRDTQHLQFDIGT